MLTLLTDESRETPQAEQDFVNGFSECCFTEWVKDLSPKIDV